MQLSISKKIPYMGVLTALSLCLSYVEMLFPLDFVIPGIKLGLSNFPVLICLSLFGGVDSIILSLAKALFSSLLFGNMTSFLYSLFGALLSIVVMLLLKRFKSLHLFAISSAGGVFHNIGQFLAALLLIRSKGLFYYLPFLIIAGLIMGLILGIVANVSLPYIKRIIVPQKNKE